MTTVDALADLLVEALSHPDRLADGVHRFQHAVWEATDRDDSEAEHEWQLLEALAYDLANFVPPPDIRRVDPAYYGRRVAEAKIREALDRLAGLRVTC
ncbi:MAG: hypothetical protein GY716_03170 [bacterium]|nr:hypothetical protein [bacterium]